MVRGGIDTEKVNLRGHFCAHFRKRSRLHFHKRCHGSLSGSYFAFECLVLSSSAADKQDSRKARSSSVCKLGNGRRGHYERGLLTKKMSLRDLEPREDGWIFLVFSSTLWGFSKWISLESQNQILRSGPFREQPFLSL